MYMYMFLRCTLDASDYSNKLNYNYIQRKLIVDSNYSIPPWNTGESFCFYITTSRALRHSEEPLFQIDAFFDQLDLDGDGRITFEEFNSHWSQALIASTDDMLETVRMPRHQG